MRINSDRRKLLAVIPTAVTVGLTGCLNDSNNDDTEPNNDDTEPNNDDAEEIEQLVVGEEDSPITLTYYFNLTCQACARFDNIVQPNLDAEYISEGIIKQEYVSVTSTTNRDSADPIHSGGYYVYEEVGTDAFVEYKNQVYSEQPTSQEAISIGVDLGADQDGMEQAVTQNLYRSVIESDIEQSQQAGVSETPSVAIDGSLLDTPSWDAIQDVVESERTN